MQTIIRLILTATLLVFVWLNAHWSVALCLTLNAAGWEVVAYQLKRLSNS